VRTLSRENGEEQSSSVVEMAGPKASQLFITLFTLAKAHTHTHNQVHTN